ncbi:tRNA guanosine(34) transglycosylase Tgt [Candidatus Shikimatogenerans bostrichidophilus]|uniref:tRNA guanosine(34) transglycosylase Tgt n=1 Tax=Candidatus Shikimatogenerans bostrichidophilus TaxID=2943807 RepID=UPI00296605EF
MYFKILHKDKKSNARVGYFLTDHGKVNTPIFMPIATKGYIKTINKEYLDIINPEIILSNTFHLNIEPGIKIIYKSGGLHSFMKWNNPIITDSGGFQVYSLCNPKKINKYGANIKSYKNGKNYFFTPKKSINIQKYIGSDIITSFDECIIYNTSKNYVKIATERSYNWLIKCLYYFNKKKKIYNHNQYLFGIIQGGLYKDIRIKYTIKTSKLKLDGYAIGGLQVGETKKEMYKIIKYVINELPNNKPIYLMGVGMPWDILNSISLGVDMFDCVIPTRNGRNGMLFTWEGIINIKNKKWKYDFTTIYNNFKNIDIYSKAYLRHLFKCNEYSAKFIASINNLYFYKSLIKKARHHIKNDTFLQWKNYIIPIISKKL